MLLAIRNASSVHVPLNDQTPRARVSATAPGLPVRCPATAPPGGQHGARRRWLACMALTGSCALVLCQDGLLVCMVHWSPPVTGSDTNGRWPSVVYKLLTYAEAVLQAAKFPGPLARSQVEDGQEFVRKWVVADALRSSAVGLVEVP